MKNTLAIIIVSCFMVACSNTNESSESVSTSDSVGESPVATSPIVTEPSPITDTSGTLTISAPQSAPGLTKTVTPAGKNPPHGEPGHRCDINVGDPLDSPPINPTGKPAPTSAAPTIAPSSAPAITNSPTLTPTTAPAPTINPAPTKTAPGMNPPHGEPGHDCGIAVGAPLKK